jgi:IS1 family transposase
MNRLSGAKRAQVVASLIEGNSIRATVRMTGVAKGTVLKLLTDLGLICSIYQDRAMRNLSCERVQVDELWAFVYSKQRNVPEHKRGEAGDYWTFVALDPDTKLVISYRVGQRDLGEAQLFMADLASRLAGRVQLTTDGFPAYARAVRDAFGLDVDYGMLIKKYSMAPKEEQRRYSPVECTGAEKVPMIGNPDPDHISTSYIERQNLTVRMGNRRFTRLTNGFSKKAENLTDAVSLHFMFYNFCRVHKTLGTTPAVAAGVADHVWKIDEIIALLDDAERAVSMKRGPYRKRSAA